MKLSPTEKKILKQARAGEVTAYDAQELNADPSLIPTMYEMYAAGLLRVTVLSGKKVFTITARGEQALRNSK